MNGWTDRQTRTGHKAARSVIPGDPRVALLAYVILIAAAFALRQVWGVFLLLLYVLILHGLSGFSLAAIWKRARTVFFFALLAVLLNALLVKGDSILAVGGRSILSREGLWRGAYFFIQIHVLFLSTGLFVSLISPEELAQGISAIVKPIAPQFAKRLALYAFLSIGFFPFFLEEFNRIVMLQRFRGGGLDGGLVRKLKGVRLLLVPLLLSAIRRSEQLAMVIELRDLKNKAGNLVALGRPRWLDYGFIAVTLIVIAAAYLSAS
ncbi:MAG: energy-coupling factor transporter transmembrane component T [Candidatus Latescibacterota bacterium]